MYKINYEKIVISEINDFVESYLSIFVKRFNDSWIFDENIIMDNHIENSIKLRISLFDWIENIFWNSEILGHKPLDNNKKQLTIVIKNFRLFIKYSEDLENKIRFIEKIEFHKK